MVLNLGKTDMGELIVECSTSIVGCEDCFILIHKADNVFDESVILGKYKNLSEVKEAANKFLEEEIPF